MVLREGYRDTPAFVDDDQPLRIDYWSISSYLGKNVAHGGEEDRRGCNLMTG